MTFIKDTQVFKINSCFHEKQHREWKPHIKEWTWNNSFWKTQLSYEFNYYFHYNRKYNFSSGKKEENSVKMEGMITTMAVDFGAEYATDLFSIQYIIPTTREWKRAMSAYYNWVWVPINSTIKLSESTFFLCVTMQLLFLACDKYLQKAQENNIR